MADDEGMTKYAVEIDKEAEKTKLAGAKKKDQSKNVPWDPEKGTEPYEKKP